MMRVLSVSDVRRRLYWAGGGPQSGGEGAPSTALLGRQFHELYGSLTGPNTQSNLVGPLELGDGSVDSWRHALIDHAYTVLVAPCLAQNESQLQINGAEVLGFWEAAQELCGWLATLMHDRRCAEPSVSLATLRSEMFLDSEVDLEIELTDPAWPGAIRLHGRADAILTRGADARRCVIELKLGRTYPEADVLQGCLYQLMLGRGDAIGADASLAMVSFEPQRHEQVFDASRLRGAQQALKALLGELAGYPPLKPATSPSSKAAAPPTASAVLPVDAGVLDEIQRKLKAAFTEYGAPLTFTEPAASGPAFIRFSATPQRGVLVSRVMSLANNVWMRMGTSKPPQISVQNGRVTIDVERPDRQSVLFSAWRAKLQPNPKGGGGRFAIGVSVDGALVCADLSESQSPHLLVVGTTGSGKSEWLRAFLASLMAINTPASLKLVLIDPKRLAFSSFERSPFLWRPVLYDEGAIELLDEMIEEMERRYLLLQAAPADDLSGYNELKGRNNEEPLPRIVCVCDEFADLLLRDKNTRKAIEQRVARLGVKGRAAGVHLVFATQRAGREVLVGTIDSNLPARLALSVPRSADSRLVLGEAGAETLLGKGDLLYKDLGAPVRLQGLVVTREELMELASP